MSETDFVSPRSFVCRSKERDTSTGTSRGESGYPKIFEDAEKEPCSHYGSTIPWM